MSAGDEQLFLDGKFVFEFVQIFQFDLDLAAEW